MKFDSVKEYEAWKKAQEAKTTLTTKAKTKPAKPAEK